MSIGYASLALEDDDIARALYRTYSFFRLRFISERDLMDSCPGHGEAWKTALEDARTLERYVCLRWAALLQLFDVPPDERGSTCRA